MKKGPVPRHVAIIMDGNGRWAQSRGLPRVAGHKAGVETVREIVKAAIGAGVEVLTLYAFSQENWKRPKDEVSMLMGLLDYFLDKEIRELVKQGVRFDAIGRIGALPEHIQRKLSEAAEATRRNGKLRLIIALNYGARAEILDAVKRLISESAQDSGAHQHGSGAVSTCVELTEERFSQCLYTAGLPDPDLLIRTSGEMRLSNFLLWQLSYAEIYITKKYWPDFHKADFLKALRDYAKRERRFGDVRAPTL